MKTYNINGINVKIHNERENKIFRIIVNTIAECGKYRNENTFDENTTTIIKRIFEETGHEISVMYWLGMIDTPINFTYYGDTILITEHTQREINTDDLMEVINGLVETMYK